MSADPLDTLFPLHKWQSFTQVNCYIRPQNFVYPRADVCKPLIHRHLPIFLIMREDMPI